MLSDDLRRKEEAMSMEIRSRVPVELVESVQCTGLVANVLQTLRSIHQSDRRIAKNLCCCSAHRRTCLAVWAAQPLTQRRCRSCFGACMILS